MTAALLFAAVSVNAQNLSEAVRYSTNSYYGTARSMALGGAMTALGGDLGSVGINPAGSAVAGYSQFTITPGVTVASTNSDYSAFVDDYQAAYDFLRQKKNSLPNLGIMFTFDTYKSHGLKSFSMGMVSNTTSSYLGGFNQSGLNDKTSFLGALAVGASPYSPAELGSQANYFGSNIPWNSLVAFQSGMIANAIGADGKPMMNGSDYVYLGATEGMNADGQINTLGALRQRSGMLTSGSKQDIVLNFGMNFNDRLFVGFNMGMPVATYRYGETFLEEAVNTSDFRIDYSDGNTAYFDHAYYEYAQTTELSGIYGKLGVLYVTPFGTRLGAAVQTPTVMTVTDRWDVYASTSFTNSAFNTHAQPGDINEYSYALIMPARYTFGVAQTFGRKGLVSFDFEMSDYSHMKYTTNDGYNDGRYFAVENNVISNFAGMAFEGRLGAEYRLTPSLSLRAGYSYQTSPYCYRTDIEGYEYDSAAYLAFYDDFASGKYRLVGAKRMFEDLTETLSAGLGYDSDGAFFADFAIRRTTTPRAYFHPYSDYITGDGTYTPEVSYKTKLVDTVLTLGWRF